MVLKVSDFMDLTINVRDIQKINLQKDEVLFIKLGVENMTDEQISVYTKNVAKLFRENLPRAKMMLTTVTVANPFDIMAIKESDLIKVE